MLNPNLATAWYISGWLKASRGEPKVALEHLARAMRLSPLEPTLYHMQAGTAFAHFLSGRYEEALLWPDKAFRDLPTYITAVSVTAASNALAGRLEEARQAMRLWRQIDTGLHMSNLTDWFPIRRPEDFAKWSDGLRRAGLPE